MGNISVVPSVRGVLFIVVRSELRIEDVIRTFYSLPETWLRWPEEVSSFCIIVVGLNIDTCGEDRIPLVIRCLCSVLGDEDDEER
jgi:hypothetical protein